MVAGASAQWGTPYWGAHTYGPAVQTWSPYYAGQPWIPQEAIKKEWDQKDGSLKSIKIDEEKLKEYHWKSAWPLNVPYTWKFDEKKEEKKHLTKRSLADDYKYSSVDVNQDGHPDNKQVYAYGAYPYVPAYTYGRTYAAYPYSQWW